MDKHPLNSYYSGTVEEFANAYINVEAVNKVIALLDLEPEITAREWKISEERTIKTTIKEQLHNEIARTISFFSNAKPTRLDFNASY